MKIGKEINFFVGWKLHASFCKTVKLAMKNYVLSVSSKARRLSPDKSGIKDSVSSPCLLSTPLCVQ